MGTIRFFRTGVLTLGLVVLLASYGLAAEPGNATRSAGGQSYRSADAALPQASIATAPGESTTLKRASKVMGAKIKSPDGTTLGDVSDVVLTPDLNGISYVVVSRGSVFGIGGTMHAIPWSALSAGFDGWYSVPISEQQFKQSRGFKSSNWPSSAEDIWAAQGADTERQPFQDNASIQARRFSRIKGSTVKTADGKSSGKVQDFVAALDSGQIVYTIVSYGGFAGLGNRYAAVPQSVVKLEPELHLARVDATPATLHANSFTPGEWPALASPSYSQQVARMYNVAPSGTALAYVPAEGTEGTAVAAAPTPKTPAKPAARAATPATPATTAEPTMAELMGTFNPANIATLDGTVIDLGKYQPTTGGSEMLWLRVRSSDGRTVLTNLGPRNYISSQDFYIVPGDRIHLNGSEVAAVASGKRVFLPTEVTYNGHTLRLRSATGTPLWEGQTTTTPAGQQPGTPSETTKPQSRAGTSGSTALGYTPAEEQTTTGTTPDQSMNQFGPTGLLALGTFDLSKPRTIDGTVTMVGKTPTAGGSDVLWMRVRTTDGQSVNVQVGPRDYVAQKDFIVVAGDRVRLNGWDAHIPGAPGAAPVFVVGDISQDGHTLQLRSRTGEPLWTSQVSLPGQEKPGAMDRSSAGRGLGTTGRTATEPNEPNKP
jgi:sporulation protein YlmC with PRC-barrel domain